MFLVNVYRLPPAHKPWLVGRERVTSFVCPDEDRASFHAGAEVDALADETGAEFDYDVTPIQVRD